MRQVDNLVMVQRLHQAYDATLVQYKTTPTVENLMAVDVVAEVMFYMFDNWSRVDGTSHGTVAALWGLLPD